jgi:F-type H+-transporting ATPase subunit b
MTEAAPLVTEAASQGVLGTLGINLKLFLGQLLNILILLGVGWKFLYRPLLRLMDERTKKIEDGLAHAKEAETRLTEAKVEEHRLLVDARAEARNIVEAAAGRGEEERKKRIALATQEIDAQIESAKRAIQEERVATLHAVKQEVVDLVMATTQKVTEQQMNDAEHRTQIERALRELEQTRV